MVQVFKDIAYASQSPAQKLDIYSPDNQGKGPYPVVVWFHPGGFTMGDKEMGIPIAAALVDRGYIAVSANYRLADEAPFPAQIYDAKAAVRWVRANASGFKFNPDKVASWGISAGTTLAALLGTSGNARELEDLSMGNAAESSRVQAVVAWYGPTDFVSLASQRRQIGDKPLPDHARSGEDLIFGGPFSKVPEKYRAASAIEYIGSGCPPFYVQHGTADEVIPVVQSLVFFDKLTAAIGKDRVELHLVENAGHFDRAHSSPGNIKASIDFLDRFLK